MGQPIRAVAVLHELRRAALRAALMHGGEGYGDWLLRWMANSRSEAVARLFLRQPSPPLAMDWRNVAMRLAATAVIPENT